MTGIYPTGTTCSGLSGALYTASYDAWGNETSRANSTTATLSYDALNRLVEYNAGSSQEFSVYDASGERVLKRSISGGTTTLTAYTYGLQELTYTGTGAFSSQIDSYSIAGHLIGSTNGTSTTYDLTDAQGSVLTTLSASAVVGEQAYGPYGNQRYVRGTLGTDKGYTGQFTDVVTGLDYYNARYYDPVIDDFLSPDAKQGNAQGMSCHGSGGTKTGALNCGTATGSGCVGAECCQGTKWNGSACVLYPPGECAPNDRACHEKKSKQAMDDHYGSDVQGFSMLLDGLSLLGDIAAIFSLQTLFSEGAVAAIIQGFLAFVHLLHFVGNLILASNLQATLGVAGVLVGAADVLSVILSALNTAWLTLGWIESAGTIIQAILAPNELTIAIGASAVIEGLYFAEGIVQSTIDATRAEQALFDDMTPAEQYNPCKSTLGEANC